MATSTKYRPEIDGLRAIAVVSVLIYHAKFTFVGKMLFPGGFLGVDIFFVISGYLIASILMKEMTNGSFSFANFYERRARRILPILLTVLLCCCVAAWITMLPLALEKFAASQLSSIFFSSNIWFSLQDSYRAEANELQPLLHTWSLSVEEQFYLLFPVVLLFLYRWNSRYITPALGACLLISLAIAQYSSNRYIDIDFYFAHTRAWELLVGVLLAKLALDGHRKPAQGNSALPIIGLILILVPMMIYHDDMPHPSVLTIPPVLGSALLIWYLPQPGITQKILSSPLFTSIGLISYSLYLWHFPIFAFAKIGKVETLSSFEKVLCLGATLAITLVGYYLIEKPARNHRLIGSKAMFGLLATAICILVGYSIYVIMSNGAEHRLGSIESIFDGARYEDSYIEQDGIRCDTRALDSKELCYFDNSSAGKTGLSEAKTIINLGDSHADVLGNPLLALAKKRGWNYQHITLPGCPYVEGAFRFKTGVKKLRCDTKNMDKIKHILKNSPPSIIVYSGRFPGYLSGEAFDNLEGGKESHKGNRRLRTDPDGPYPSKSIDELMQLTINNLLADGHTVVLVYPIPEVGWHLPNLVKNRLDRIATTPVSAKRKAYENMEISTSYNVYKARSKQTIEAFDAIADKENLIRIRPDKMLCSDTTGRCYTHDNKGLFYYDNNHLSQYGSQLLIDQVDLQLAQHK